VVGRSAVETRAQPDRHPSRIPDGGEVTVAASRRALSTPRRARKRWDHAVGAGGVGKRSFPDTPHPLASASARRRPGCISGINRRRARDRPGSPERYHALECVRSHGRPPFFSPSSSPAAAY
jgi:hypothetical protein